MATLASRISKASQLLQGKTLAVRLHFKSQEKADSEARVIIGELLQEVPKSSSCHIYLEKAAKDIDGISDSPEPIRSMARTNALLALLTANTTLFQDTR